MTNDLDRRFLLGGLAGAAGITALSSMAKAGPLNPPAGAITSTSKPLGELEPRTAVNAANTPGNGYFVHILAGPGSYYLTGNVSVGANHAGILLGAGATLDLNGFTIAGSGNTSIGVQAGAGSTVRNGVVTNVFSAVTVGVSATTNVNIEDVKVNGFTDRAFDIGGKSVVRRCNVSGAGVVGVEMQGDYGVLEDCTISNTSATGAYINSYSTLRRCELSGCATGAYIGYGSVADSCVFASNTSTGLQASQRSSVRNCVAINTTVGAAGAPRAGFDLADGAEALGCTCLSNYYGIRASTAARISDCTFDQCAAAAIKITGAGTTVESCRINRSSIAVDMTGATGNYVHKCVMMGNGTSVAVNLAGNWYPNIPLGGTNTATNPLASVVG